MRRQQRPDPARRDLLKTARNAAAASAAAAVLGPAGAAAPTPQPVAAPIEPTPADAPQGGYRESDHTRRYYALARF